MSGSSGKPTKQKIPSLSEIAKSARSNSWAKDASVLGVDGVTGATARNPYTTRANSSESSVAKKAATNAAAEKKALGFSVATAPTRRAAGDIQKKATTQATTASSGVAAPPKRASSTPSSSGLKEFFNAGESMRRITTPGMSNKAVTPAKATAKATMKPAARQAPKAVSRAPARTAVSPQKSESLKQWAKSESAGLARDRAARKAPSTPSKPKSSTFNDRLVWGED